jgi:hypothetical protein
VFLGVKMFKIGILPTQNSNPKITNHYELGFLAQKSPNSCQKMRFYSDYLKKLSITVVNGIPSDPKPRLLSLMAYYGTIFSKIYAINDSNRSIHDVPYAINDSNRSHHDTLYTPNDMDSRFHGNDST